MSQYEEKQLLNRLQSLDDAIVPGSSAYVLRRKLLMRQKQREHGLATFNIDAFMQSLVRLSTYNRYDNFIADQRTNGSPSKNVSSVDPGTDCRILDRYQPGQCDQEKPRWIGLDSDERMTFTTRIMGMSDSQLSAIYSPYTTRLLKPFIRRDFEICPPKLRLLQEIVAYPHRSDSKWRSKRLYPIDFCYVRPAHIPSANELCRQFFWPGINLTDSLQYPDSSCVVLYRKLVIGFAFVVPDVAFNESYVSFIFTHPEWRRAGIASFMLYHLIQTSSGKDLTLHVSTSNPALLLYQKFGFKEEEFILDFYEKYFPEDSRECRHAFFLRLRR
jgi:ribosomal protein S18 acetylase RimI-like enzyme